MSLVTGLVELHDLPQILPHMERSGTRLAVHVHLQGHVRDCDAAQPDVVSHYRILHLCHLP